MIDFDYTAPELIPFRIQQVRESPDEPLRIGGVEYAPIVRCSDCVHYETDEVCDGCTLFDFADCSGSMADKFCAWGEMAENIIIGESYKQPSENDGEVIKNGGQYKFDGEVQTVAYAPYPLSVKANNPQGEVFVTGLTLHDGAERSKTEHDTRDKLESEDAPNQPISESDAQKSAENAESGATTGYIRNFDATVDTREKLEADLEKLRKQWKEYDGNFMRIYSYVAYSQIVELLDRQAAITERELCKKCEWPLLAAMPDREAYDRIAELTAEVEKQRQRANDAERGVLSDEWYVARDRYEDDVAALTAERDKWRARAEQVQESYLDAKDSRDKLTAELETYRKYADQGERMKPQSKENGDTREQLEADMYNTIAVLKANAALVGILTDGKQRGLAEDIGVNAWELEQLFKDLLAECDRLREAIDAMNNGQFYAMYRRACEERDELKREHERERQQMQRVIHTQAESFCKLEVELAGI